MTPQPYVTSGATSRICPASAAGTVTKWYGDGPRQRISSPSNRNRTPPVSAASPAGSREVGDPVPLVGPPLGRGCVDPDQRDGRVLGAAGEPAVQLGQPVPPLRVGVVDDLRGSGQRHPREAVLGAIHRHGV